MAVVDQVTTPTLVIHSELDFRCPLEQATRYYSALKRQGTDAEMLVFPGENHELTRSGQPRHRVERFARRARLVGAQAARRPEPPRTRKARDLAVPGLLDRSECYSPLKVKARTMLMMPRTTSAMPSSHHSTAAPHERREEQVRDRR